MRRAARRDGAFPGKLAGETVGMLSPEEVREIVAFIGLHRAADGPFDVVIGGASPGDDPLAAAALTAAYAAGATWWVESFSGARRRWRASGPASGGDRRDRSRRPRASSPDRHLGRRSGRRPRRLLARPADGRSARPWKALFPTVAGT
jgi:hypothetical protein